MEIKGKVHCFFDQSKEEWKDIKGFEISEDYYNKAINRIRNHTQQLTLFDYD